MIGAMPAVAVRHERRKQEKRNKRPSMLHLYSGARGGDGDRGGGIGVCERSSGGGRGGGGGGDVAAAMAAAGAGGGGGGDRPPPLQQHKHQSPPSRGSSPAHSPLASPPSHHDDLAAAMEEDEFYVCGKVSVLHLVVVSLLLGAILLIVGLVQLKPGADASDHRYYLLAAGGLLMAVGLVLTALRCWLLPWRRNRRLAGGMGGCGGYEARGQRHAAAVSAAACALQQRLRKEDSQVAALTASAVPPGDGPECCDEAEGDDGGGALDAVLVNACAEVFTPALETDDCDTPRLVTSDGGGGEVPNGLATLTSANEQPQSPPPPPPGAATNT